MSTEAESAAIMTSKALGNIAGINTLESILKKVEDEEGGIIV